MKSQPLQTAFTSMTIALVVFLSIWVIQASQAELTDKTRISLQVNASPDRDENRRKDSKPDPFDRSETQHNSLSANDRTRIPRQSDHPTVEIQSVQVRQVSKPHLSQRTIDPDSQSQALELPEIDRMHAALAEESSRREGMQLKIDSLTREQAELKTALEREQTQLSLTRQEKDVIAEKLGESETELDRLHSTTTELRSETVEMKNTLQQVTSEFDSLRKRMEELQQQPRELASLPYSQTEVELIAPPPPPDVPPPNEEDFLPPIKKEGKPSVPLAPPTEEPRIPLIEADPSFRESEEMDCDYPPMMVGESCAETEETPARGLLPMLCRNLKRKHAESSEDCTAAETCEPESPRRKGMYYDLCDFVQKHKKAKPQKCHVETDSPCECGCDTSKTRGLIPNIGRWIENCKTHGCFADCCCSSR